MATLCRFVFFLVGVLYTSAAEDFFVENPMSIEVTLGGDVHFWCQTADTFECVNMNWVFTASKTEGDPFGVIGTCRTPNYSWDSSVNQRLTQSFEHGRFGLHITNVSYGDSGRYSCWVTKAVGGDAITEYSAVAFLTVLSPVPTPLCRYTPEVVSIGSEVQLTCGVPRDAFMETVKLTWVYDSTGSVRSVQAQRGETFSLPCYTLSESDNYKVFTCVAGADNTNGPNCTLSPLQIPMTVEITPVFGEAETKFICNVDAVPPVTNYHWSIQEMDSSSNEWTDIQIDRSHIENEGATLVLTTGRDIGLRMSTTCTASNSIGLTNSSAPVSTLQCSSGVIVTELTRCEDLPETTSAMVTTEKSTRSVRTGRPQGTDDGIGIYVWIIVAAVALLVIVAIICCIFLVRYRRTSKSKKATDNDLIKMGVAYNTDMGSVDLRSHTGTSESNALMMEAEVVLAASNSSLQQLDNRLEQTTGNNSPRIVAPVSNDGLGYGETYASIDNFHQPQRPNQSGLRHSAGDLSSGPHKSSHDGYDTIGPDIFQQSVSFDGGTRRNPSEVDLVDSTYASVGNDRHDEVRIPPELATQPCAYESIDLNTSQVRTSVRDSSSLKKVCVVSPTCHLNDGADNQVVYAMPDKQRKSKIDNGDSKTDQEPPAGIVYAKPDKKHKKPVEKYRKKSTNSDNTSNPSTKSRPQNVPEGLYAMPDKSQNRSSVSSSVNPQDARDDSTNLRSAISEKDLPSKIQNQALYRSNSITPKKPHRTASSKVAGSKILRDSIKRQSDSRSISRSSSTEDNLEASTPSVVPAESDIVRKEDTSSSIPIYAVLEKGSQ